MSAVAERNHSLDALRASALLAGVVLHAALAYLPGGAPAWAVVDRNTHVGFAIFVLVVHSFRLEVFFLLAGFFGRLLYLRRGGPAFWQNRLKRILLPFVLGWMLVFPLLAFCWIWASMQAARAAIGPALATGYGHALRELTRFVIGEKGAAFPLTHLWFLYYLLLVYAVFLGARWLLARQDGIRERWCRVADAVGRWVFGSAWGLPLAAGATGLVLLTMREWGVDTPDKTFLPHVPALLLYSLVFALGWQLHRQTELLESLCRRWHWHTGAAGAATLLALVVSGGIRANPSPVLWPLFQFAYALMMWSCIFASVGLFLRWRQTESALWRYLADSSYWVYVIHLPIVVALQVALSRTDWSAGLKFVTVTAVATLVALATYHLLVRSTPVGVLLNGRRVPLRLAWR
ncbi:acyltransferase family protein [Opitutus terrae]|uniref:Acyltransferase 3 n=1 Tax=Opitutus terrae (strain DSM 11246 / JCM 15787 / PB90-1) TaxID=452637 RepID=B1ZNG6_OPITP|nr:acyltransferase family protein [Opitutus terrae]ACB74400.1 acyltransferase 3 [Opitutus terrae PB90-1]